jgi:hypothetical protein
MNINQDNSIQKKPLDSNNVKSTNDFDQVESTTENDKEIYPMDEKSYYHPKCFVI